MIRWDFMEKRYFPYIVPSDWKVTVFETHMNSVVNCAQCGKKITYGSGYTSKQIHNSMGMGFIVCPACHELELIEERKNAPTVIEGEDYDGDS